MLTLRTMPPLATEGSLSLFLRNRPEPRAAPLEHPTQWIMPRSHLLPGGQSERGPSVTQHRTTCLLWHMVDPSV